MREFHFKALSPAGETISGFRRSNDMMTLETELASQNLVLLNARASLGLASKMLRRRRRPNSNDLRDFTLHMATCLGAGVPLIQALRDFEESIGDTPFRETVRELRGEVAGGNQVTEAMNHHPEAFSPLYISLISAGESSGSLDTSFMQLVEHLEWQDGIRGQMKQAMVYPAILGTAVAGLFLLMMLYVIPRFMGVFKDMDVQLPTLTLKVIGLSDMFIIWWPLILGAVVLAVAGFNVMRRTAGGRYLLDSALLRAPVVGTFALRMALARFARNFSTLLGAGVDIIRVLEMLEHVVDNSAIGRDIKAVRMSVITGEGIAESFARYAVFPPLLQRLIAVGENTGQLEATMLKAGHYLDKDLPRTLKRLFTFMEAAIIVILGALIAVAALSMLLPIFSIQGQLMK